MIEGRPHRLGSGELTAVRVLRDALSMLRQNFVRIAAAAVIFFAVPALVAAVTVDVITQFVGEQDALVVIAAVVGLVVAATVRILGPVAFAGFLDQAVAKEYLYGHHSTLADVMRRLPWRRLIAVDLIVTFVVGLGLSLLIVPGLVLYGLFGMVGPVVVQEGAGVRDSLRRTMQLARFAPSVAALLVVLPFAFEEVLHEVMYQTLHHSGLGVQVLSEWIVAIVVGGTLGLLEVALAAELMVRHPLTEPEHTAAEQPVDGGRADQQQPDHQQATNSRPTNSSPTTSRPQTAGRPTAARPPAGHQQQADQQQPDHQQAV